MWYNKSDIPLLREFFYMDEPWKNELGKLLEEYKNNDLEQSTISIIEKSESQQLSEIAPKIEDNKILSKKERKKIAKQQELERRKWQKEQSRKLNKQRQVNKEIRKRKRFVPSSETRFIPSEHQVIFSKDLEESSSDHVTIHDYPQRNILDVLQEACKYLGIDYHEELNKKFKEFKIKTELIYLCCLYGIQGKEINFERAKKYAEEIIQLCPHAQQIPLPVCLYAYFNLKCRKLSITVKKQNELINSCINACDIINNNLREAFCIIWQQKRNDKAKKFYNDLKFEVVQAIMSSVYDKDSLKIAFKKVNINNIIIEFLSAYVERPKENLNCSWEDIPEETIEEIKKSSSPYKCFKCVCNLIMTQYFYHPINNKNVKPKMVKQNLNNSFYNIKRKEITATIFLIRTNINVCSHKNHLLIDMMGIIKIIEHNGNVIEVKIPIGYCQKCDKYYILQTDYSYLKTKGTVICKNTEKELAKQTEFDDYDIINSQSILRACGYTVNVQDNLSVLQRQQILKKVVDEKILTKIEICSHIDWLINRSKSQPQLNTARQKWIEDRKFIAAYKNDELNTIEITSVEKNIYRKR